MSTTPVQRRAISAATVLLASGLAAWPAAGAPDTERRANKPPIAIDDDYTLPEDARLLVRGPGVRANDADPEGKPLTVRIVRKPRHGTARLSRHGRLRYQPDANWSGTDRLVYVARDAGGKKDRAKVTLTVSPVNDRPSMSMKATTPVREGSASRLTITANDADGGPLDYFFDCNGDGPFEVGPQASNVYECAYANDGTKRPAGRVRDAAGARARVSLRITVTNVSPDVTAAEGQQGTAGTPTTVDLGSFADPGLDGPWQVTVAWGDGSGPTTFTAATAGDLGSRNHTYADTREPLEVYSVVVTVTEAGGGATGSAAFSVDVTS